MLVAGSATATEIRELLEHFYAAVNERDHARGLALVSDDFEWEVPPEALHAGTHRGRDEAARIVDSLLESFDEFEIELEELHERGDTAVAVIRQRARGLTSGAEVEVRIAHMWTVSDGSLTRLEEFAQSENALRALATDSRTHSNG
jgi:uncharacterized protein